MKYVKLNSANICDICGKIVPGDPADYADSREFFASKILKITLNVKNGILAL